MKRPRRYGEPPYSESDRALIQGLRDASWQAHLDGNQSERLRLEREANVIVDSYKPYPGAPLGWWLTSGGL